MLTLGSLKNTTRPKQARKRVGRGIGSGLGKTCGRGHKGAGSRSGYKRRHGTEGGQLPLYRRLPTRGFSNVRFSDKPETVNLKQIEMMFEAGEVVNIASLKDKGFFSGRISGLKILGDGDLSKKVTIEANSFSVTAKAKLDAAGISYTEIASCCETLEQ